MSAQVCLERTKCLLSTLSPPCLHPCLYHPSLPLQVLWAPLGSHPSLSHTGPIIGAAHKLVGLQMGRACRTCIWFLQPGQRPASQTKKKKKKWSSGFGQANVFSMFLKIEVNTVQDCSCTSCGRGCEALWVGWSLGKRLNWFGHWELKAVHLNMKDMIIQWPSGLPVSSDWINRRNLKTHTRRFGNWVRREAKVWEWARDQESSSF